MRIEIIYIKLSARNLTQVIKSPMAVMNKMTSSNDGRVTRRLKEWLILVGGPVKAWLG